MVANVERIGGKESNGSEAGGLDSLMCLAKWGAETNGQIGKEDCRQRANESNGGGGFAP